MPMRKALVVGINYYAHISNLFGCVNDAQEVKSVLEFNHDGSANFGVIFITSTGTGDAITRGDLKDRVSELFAGDNDIALFYFAGHGYIEPTGGYL